MPIILRVLLAASISIVYGAIIYWDVSRLIQDEVARVKMQHSAAASLLRMGGTIGGHLIVITGYGLALGFSSVVTLIFGAFILFFPTALVLSSFVIKALGKGVVFLSTGVNCMVMIFLKIWGVL